MKRVYFHEKYFNLEKQYLTHCNHLSVTVLSLLITSINVKWSVTFNLFITICVALSFDRRAADRGREGVKGAFTTSSPVNLCVTAGLECYLWVYERKNRSQFDHRWHSYLSLCQRWYMLRFMSIRISLKLLFLLLLEKKLIFLFFIFTSLPLTGEVYFLFPLHFASD